MREPKLDRRSVLRGTATIGLAVSTGSSELFAYRADPPPAEKPILFVADFRAPHLSDREVLTKAFSAWVTTGGTLHLEPNRLYDLGDHAGPQNVFDLPDLTGATLLGNGATLRLRSIGTTTYNVLYLTHYSKLHIQDLRCVDDGFQGNPAVGAKFIVADTSVKDSLFLSLQNLAGQKLVSFIQVQGVIDGPRVRGISFRNCTAIDVFYGLACLNQGDDVTGDLRTVNSGRSYFVYGVQHQDVQLAIEHQGPGKGPIAETPILIKSYGIKTVDIAVNATFLGDMPWSEACATLEQQAVKDAPLPLIENIQVTLNIAPETKDSHLTPRMALRIYDLQGKQLKGTAEGTWASISLAGELRLRGAMAIVSDLHPPQRTTIVLHENAATVSQSRAPGFLIVDEKGQPHPNPY